jgi:hypothetical protein
MLNYSRYQNKPLKEELIVEFEVLVKSHYLFDYIQMSLSI